MNSTIIIMFSVIIATVIVGLAPAFGKKAAKKQSSSTSEYFLGSRGLGVVLWRQLHVKIITNAYSVNIKINK